MIKIYKWQNLTDKTKQELLQRSNLEIIKAKEKVKEWLEKIKQEQDKAVLDYIRQFDQPKFLLQNLKVAKKEIKTAYQKTGAKTVRIIKEQIRLAQKFHQAQIKQEDYIMENITGVLVGRKSIPIESVGLYVPAGSAPLPTVMQILAVAAKTAGVPRIVACFPPKLPNYEMLVAADLIGVDEIYRVGGVAAIAVLAYGTQTIKPVLKIVGPGSIYVQAAKALVQDTVAIDMISGPSEILIIADEKAKSNFIASDMLAQSEHDINACSIVLTSSLKLAEKIKREIIKQFSRLSRKQIIQESLKKYSAIIVVKDIAQSIQVANDYAPEHLEIQTENPWEIWPQIKNAGSIFLGEYAPVAAGDYASGTNLCLPTGFWVKVCSAISVKTFLKDLEFQYITKTGLKNLYPIIERISQVEGLDAHLNSVKIRLNNTG